MRWAEVPIILALVLAISWALGLQIQTGWEFAIQWAAIMAGLILGRLTVTAIIWWLRNRRQS
jgi:hypothetical protein